MARHPYKMRRVIGQVNDLDKFERFRRWGVPVEGAARLSLRDLLECGHVKAPEMVDSTADGVRVLFRAITRAEHKRRCHECAKEAAHAA